MKIPAFFKSKKGKILLGIVVMLVVFRIALPYILLHYANKKLAAMNGYYGRVQDIDVALLRGAYRLDSFYLNKVEINSGRQTAFLSSEAVDLSLEWKALFKGKLVGELVFEQPNLRFTENRVELDDVSKDTSDFRQLLRDFMPIKVNRCEIRNGNLRYIDQTAKPEIDVSITELNALASNLRNAYSSKEVLPATIDATGDVYSGDLNISMKINPLAVRPAFDLNAELEGTDLTKLNDIFQAYGGFDVNKGKFNMYTEAVTKDGKFTGYVKPIIHDLDVVSWKGQDKKDGFFQKIWESVVGGAGKLLENPDEEQVATKVNFKGDIENPKANIWQVVVLTLQNAFVKAISPSIENKISLSKLAGQVDEEKTTLKSLFRKDKKKKKKK